MKTIKEETHWYRRAILVFTYHVSSKGRIKDTAKHLKCSEGYVSEAIKLVKYHNKININGTREKALEELRNGRKKHIVR